MADLRFSIWAFQPSFSRFSDDTIVDTVLIDAWMKESHSFKSSSSDILKETGDIESDHIRNLPVRIKLVGRVTDTPVSNGTLANFIPGLDFYKSTVESKVGRAEKILKKLLVWYENKYLFRVATGFAIYKNVFFEELEIQKERPVFSYDFNATLKFFPSLSSSESRKMTVLSREGYAKSSLSQLGIVDV